MSYASYEDVEARWRPLSSDEKERVIVLLNDAASILDAFVKVNDDDASQAELLKVVSCNMVIRAMSSSDTFGVTQASMTAGPYTQSWSYANPSGDLYLTKNEKRLLGITSGYIGSIEPRINGFYGANDD